MGNDEEVCRQIESINSEVERIKKKIKSTKVLYYIDEISYTILYFFIVIPICKNEIIQDNYNFLLLIILVTLLYIIYYILHKKTQLLNDVVENLSIEISKINKEKQDLLDFKTYLVSYRKVEAQNAGYEIYPDIYSSDAEYTVEHYKNKFEGKRVKYEENHIEFLKLNKHYLDEKLLQAPISAYPLSEQTLLQEREKELKKATQ